MTLIVFAAGLSSCRNEQQVAFTDNEPLVIELDGKGLTILQLTDLHLTYGIDYNDRRTYKAVETLVESADFDLVVFTGDIVMSPFAVPLFARLVSVMDKTGVPWTFVLGNHDTDYHDPFRLVSVAQRADNLFFKAGPQLEDGGVGNFKITFTLEDVPFYHAYFFDTKSEREPYTEEEGKYDHLSEAQVAWYENFVSEDTVPSIAFMHTPLRQFLLIETLDDDAYEGRFGEPVHPQGVDTGFFDVALAIGMTRGVFVGHDHENDFAFEHEGMLLAYGRLSGYNGYGSPAIGGRVIHIDENGVLSTWVITEDEVGE